MYKIKRLFVLLTAVLLCFSLCSCMELDQMKAMHAIWQEDGSILWNDAAYLKVTGYSIEEIFTYIESLNMYSRVLVTDADIPVLLSDRMGVRMSPDTEKTILFSYGNEYLFAREDVYQQVLDELESLRERKVPEELEMRFYVSQIGKLCNIPLTDDHKAAIASALRAVNVISDPLIYCDAAEIVGYNAYGEAVETVAMFMKTADGRYSLVKTMDGSDYIYYFSDAYVPIMAELHDLYSAGVGTAAEEWPPTAFENVTYYVW